MAQFPVATLSKRFLSVLRSDGAAEAVRRAGRFATRWARGGGNSALTHGGKAQGEERYLSGVWQTLARQEAFHIPAGPATLRRRRRIAMIADLNLPQCRKYRVEQLAAFWRDRGVAFDYAHYQDVPRAVRIMQHATHLMEYRLQSGPVAEMLRYEARRLRLPVLYDIDDPLFSVSAYETYRNMDALDPGMKAHFVGEAPKYLSMMNGADILSVSTPGMAAHVGLFSSRPVHVRRNFADAQTLEAGARAMQGTGEKGPLFRVAFASGSQGHEIDLAEILTPLARFIAEAPNRRLLILGHFDRSQLPADLKTRLEVEKFSTYDSYLAALARADCAVMPLCDDSFNRCKSAVRVLDAAAVGVPAIVSPVGDLPEVIRAGETGHIAATSDDWLDALRDLARNPSGAAAMGRQARQEVARDWCGSDRPHIYAADLIDWIEG